MAGWKSVAGIFERLRGEMGGVCGFGYKCGGGLGSALGCGDEAGDRSARVDGSEGSGTGVGLSGGDRGWAEMRIGVEEMREGWRGCFVRGGMDSTAVRSATLRRSQMKENDEHWQL